MTRRDRVLGAHRDVVLAAAAANKATSIAVGRFGARGEATSRSDYDFLTCFAEGASLFNCAGLELDLDDLLDVEVDVISRGGMNPEHMGSSPTPSRCAPWRTRRERPHRRPLLEPQHPYTPDLIDAVPGGMFH